MYAKIVGLSAAAVLTATSAMAATNATATTDLNLRAGPGPMAEILDVIPGDETVEIEQCATGLEWCKVTYDGTEGWAYSPYLTATIDSEPVVVYDNVKRLDVESVDVNEDDRAASATAGGLTAGALAMSLVGGPAAVAAGVLAGTALGAAAVPEKTVTYVTEHPVEPVYLNGEVVVGAGIPQEVTLADIPDTPESYAYVNGQPVIVDQDRTIIHVVR
ncbi:DUF1236 domain-containing protein [Pseudooceanicola sediminis]|uniref:DUF1236 domain-containing protein n=1 Tax=Pseudooceanicola sediminis TaxID=2211117 RepID=A0A399IY11_9RHOB|nr:DUF1236 domain-containing protein [Pseudooceanicola sediminis]RII37911.1 DUF1236 domain-containing protein [Pseudooceanicola sediminis]|tara:strand:- start:1504 stop:2154 length:651 start_codon:yes stop_codon:yes gene_type:complete